VAYEASGVPQCFGPPVFTLFDRPIITAFTLVVTTSLTNASIQAHCSSN